MNYTQAQIDRANAVSLEDFLRTQGETLIKSGREYRWKEHDSLTVRGNKWFRHSQSKGGYPIDFVMEFYGKSFPEAVQLLTGESAEGQSEASTAPPTAFHLPLHNRTADRAIQYLCESRGLNKTLVEAFLLSGDIYEDSKRHNVVFVGRDRSGTPRYAHVRGTQESFRQDIAGSDKSYPFRYEGNGSQLFVFEAPIDLLSFICLYPQDWQTRSYLALGGVSGKALKYHKVTGEEPGKELKSWSYSVKEVADLLGVDEYLVYDLLKKNQMEAVIVDYWKRIPKESFQNWYKSQSRYRTKEDREKDALLEDATITMPEMAQLLGTTRSAVYTILDNPKYSHFFEFIVIAEKKRITKESFQKFLEGQDRYKLDPSNDYEELAQEQNIALANFRRKKLSQTGIRGSNGNIKYLTFDEASYLAKVSRSMINKWADKGKFTVIKVGSRVRIRRDEFEDWMEQRDLERSMQ